MLKPEKQQEGDSYEYSCDNCQAPFCSPECQLRSTSTFDYESTLELARALMPLADYIKALQEQAEEEDAD